MQQTFIIRFWTLGSFYTRSSASPCTSTNSLAPADISFTSCGLFLALCPAALQSPSSMPIYVTSRLDHCSSILVGLPLVLTARLDRVLRRAARLIGRICFCFSLFARQVALAPNCPEHLL